MATGASRGTCRSSTGCSELDFFFVQNALALGVRTVETIEDAGTKPHVPVALTFHSRITTARALFLRLPPPLPTERVYGPVQPDPDWTKARELTRKLAADALESARDDQFDQRYREAYEEWADLAELEVFQKTHQPDMIKFGLRGREPKLVWRSIVPERVSDPANDAVTQWRTLGGIATDLVRLTTIRRDFDDDSDDLDYHLLADDAARYDQLEDCIDVIDNMITQYDDVRAMAARLRDIAMDAYACCGAVGQAVVAHSGQAHRRVPPPPPVPVHAARRPSLATRARPGTR